MTILDGLIVIAFVIYAASAGFRTRRQASVSLEEYFLAGRRLKGYQAGISMAATQFAADTPLLVTGLIATAGIFSLWRLWIYALAFLLLGFVLAPSWRRAGVLTDAQLTELRYGGRPAAVLRAFKAVYFGTVFNCTVLAMVLFAAKEIAEPFLLWDQWLPAFVFEPAKAVVQWVGVPLVRSSAGGDPWVGSSNNLISIFAIAAVTLLYSTTGGLRSVVQTDLLQFAVMITATAAYAIWVIDRTGGLSAMARQIHDLYADGGPGGILPDQILAFTPCLAKDVTWAMLAVFALQWLVQMNADGTGYLAQRAMACESDNDAKQATVVFTVVQILLRSLLWLPIGLGLLVLFPADQSLPVDAVVAQRESTFVRGIAQLLPTGLSGLMLTAMLAALASTIDTHLNWGASYWTNDLYKRFFCQGWRKQEPSARSLVRVARLSNVLILVVGLAIMTQLDSIQVAWQISLLLGSGMGVMLVLRWVWWRVNAWGELAALATSTLMAPVLLYGVSDEHEAMRLLLMALASTAAGIGASLAGGPERPDRLRAFYTRARPPGFWTPVAMSVGDEPSGGPRSLGRGLAAMTVGAFSIFCLLTGLGSLIASSPPPHFLPIRWLWITALLMTGTVLIPVWWRWAFKQTHGSADDPPTAKG